MKLRNNFLVVLTGVFLCTVLMPLSQASANPPAMATYCIQPPFLVARTQPNVMIVLDNSGSMEGAAFLGSYDPAQFSTGHYYGYFEPTTKYKWTTSVTPNRWVPTTDDISTGDATNPIIIGDLLNWATMKRVDISKKILIGGKARSGTYGSSTDLSDRSTNPVILYGHNQGSSFNKTYTPTTSEISPPFAEDSYKFAISSSRTLTLTSMITTPPANILPGSDLSLPSAWTVNPSSTSAYADLDDPVSGHDSDNTYVQNLCTTSSGACTYSAPLLLAYNKAAIVPPVAGVISSVTVMVTAKKYGTSTSSTRSITGVLRMHGASADSNYTATAANVTTSYVDYSFGWSKNPITGAVWNWSQILGTDVNSLLGFGVQASTTPSSSDYYRITRMYLVVTISNPAGTYSVIVDQGATPASGVLNQMAADAASVLSEVRFGLTEYNADQGGHVVNTVDSGQVDSITASISDMDPSNWTPLGETLYEIYRYFRQESPYFAGSCSKSGHSCTTSADCGGQCSITGNTCTSDANCQQCAITGDLCASDADCDSCSNTGNSCTTNASCGQCTISLVPCTSDANCNTGTCSNTGTSCSSATDCQKVCSNNHNKTCTKNSKCSSNDCGYYQTCTTVAGNTCSLGTCGVGANICTTLAGNTCDTAETCITGDYTTGASFSGASYDEQTALGLDPYFYKPPVNTYVPCTNTFVLFLTDGESTQDQSVPGSSTSSPYAACSSTNIKACSGHKPAGSTATWTPPNPRFAGTSIGTTYASSGTDYMIDVAFWGRSNDMRANSDGSDCPTKPTTWSANSCLPKAQNIYLYPVFLFGTGSTLLKDAAIYGGFNDLNGNGVPDCVTDPAECYRDSDEDGVIRSDGSDDPITYYEGDDGYKLQDSIKNALSAIVRRTASGTAASVLASGEGSGANLLQSIFYPRRSISNQPDIYWSSTLMNLWYYLDKGTSNSTIRENTADSAANGVMQLNLDKDYIVNFFFDSASQMSKANLYADASPVDGLADSTTPNKTVDASDMKYLWEAGLELWNTPAAQCASGAVPTLATPCRNILTNLTDTAATGTTAFAGMQPFVATDAALATGSPKTLQTLLNTDLTVGSSAGQRSAANNTIVAKNVISYVRGIDGFCSNDQSRGCGSFDSNPTNLPCVSPGTCKTFVKFTSPDETINYRSRTTGIDLSNPKNDTVLDSYTLRGETWSELPKVWKLGDIVNSTQRVVSWIPQGTYNTTYNDTTYNTFVNSASYKRRGMVFVGSNDGMLHAFKLGTLDLTVSGNIKAQLCEDDGAGGGTANNGKCEAGETNKGNLGKERWAFIPKNALPYLQYLDDPSYCHLYYTDLTPYVFDASIEAPGQPVSGNYWTTARTSSSWRTILIGGMRFGGGCKSSASTFGVKTPATDIGYSSYYALDITDPEAPQFLWEFTNPALGFASSGPAIVKIKARKSTGTNPSTTDEGKDGKWFVVLASGPTGPVGTSQFKGYSDQHLQLFVLDLKTGGLLTTIDTGIANAFGGSLNNATIDYDFDYQDDALYMGYTKAEDTTPSSTTIWNKGGVLRLLTREDLNGYDVSPTATAAAHGTALNPANWRVSKVVDNIGAVTASVSHLAHYPVTGKTPDKAYLYFASGRYFFPSDDGSTRQALYGIVEPCLSKIKDITTDPALSALHSTLCDENSGVPFTCSTTLGVKDPPGVTDADGNFVSKDLIDPVSCLDDATDNSALTAATNGWFIDLADKQGSSYTERVITDPVAAQTGVVYFTSVSPDSDICAYGGASYLWAVKYDTAASVSDFLSGIALVQVSTGDIEQIQMKDAFRQRTHGDGTPDTTDTTDYKLNRRTGGITGVPPTGQGLSLVVPPQPTNRMMHMRQK